MCGFYDHLPLICDFWSWEIEKKSLEIKSWKFFDLMVYEPCLSYVMMYCRLQSGWNIRDRSHCIIGELTKQIAINHIACDRFIEPKKCEKILRKKNIREAILLFLKVGFCLITGPKCVRKAYIWKKKTSWIIFWQLYCLQTYRCLIYF